MPTSDHAGDTDDGGLKIRRLGRDDAAGLARLLTLYAAAMVHEGEPPRPVAADVARLLADPVAEVLGAFEGDALLGFAVVFDLPEAISGRRAGQLDDLFVDPAARGRGIASRLIASAVAEGERRGWVHLRWLVPDGNAAAALYDRLAERAPWASYVIRIDRSVRW